MTQHLTVTPAPSIAGLVEWAWSEIQAASRRDAPAGYRSTLDVAASIARLGVRIDYSPRHAARHAPDEALRVWALVEALPHQLRRTVVACLHDGTRPTRPRYAPRMVPVRRGLVERSDDGGDYCPVWTRHSAADHAMRLRIWRHWSEAMRLIEGGLDNRA